MNSARATPLPPGQSLLDGAAYDEGAAAADFQVGKTMCRSTETEAQCYVFDV